VPTVFYSYSFAQNPNWSTVYSPGKEIYEYLQDVCNRNGITDKVHLNTDVRTCRWLESEEVWEVQLGHMKPGMGKLSSKERAQRIKERGDDESIWVSTEVVRCKILVSAVGGIAEPKARPENVPGFEKFSGDCVHSARWDHKIDCNGKNVVVVGTGSSSTQLVPSLLKEPHNAKTVTQIMRSPPWVLEKPTPPGQ
jgi:cation diffusion facilitator CzcD-associated flavoprotein CzcO